MSSSSPPSRRFAPYADIREYAVKMFENRGRGIGAKGKDNGLLVAARGEGSPRLGGSRLRPRAVHHRRLCRRGEPHGHDAVFRARRVRTRPARGSDAADRANRARTRRHADRRAAGRAATAARTSQFSPWLIIAIIIIVMLMNNAGGRRSRMRRGNQWGAGPWSGWNSGVGPFGGGGGIGGGGFGGGFGGFGGGRSGGGGGGAGW